MMRELLVKSRFIADAQVTHRGLRGRPAPEAVARSFASARRVFLPLTSGPSRGVLQSIALPVYRGLELGSRLRPQRRQQGNV